MNPSNYISEEKEIERYQEHYNSINDIGYQNFVSPILTKIQTSFKKLKVVQRKLHCMTDLYDETIDFEKWCYKDDTTQVIFYPKKPFEWLANQLNF